VGRAQEGQGTRARDEMNEERDTDARLWHPWLRINRVLSVMLHTRWTQLVMSSRCVASPSAKLSSAAGVSRGGVGHHGIRGRAESGGHDSRQLSKTTHAARSRNSEENIKPT
jgi:hypothetical protein